MIPRATHAHHHIHHPVQLQTSSSLFLKTLVHFPNLGLAFLFRASITMVLVPKIAISRARLRSVHVSKKNC